MSFLGAGVIDVDFGSAFGVEVGVGAVGHDFTGEGHNVAFGGGGIKVAAGTESGLVVGHVAFVGVGEEGEKGE